MATREITPHENPGNMRCYCGALLYRVGRIIEKREEQANKKDEWERPKWACFRCDAEYELLDSVRGVTPTGRRINQNAGIR